MSGEIGGYFELELNKGQHYHQNFLRLNTARNCFEYILRARQCCKVYIPYYTCQVMLEPINLLGISYEFYHIDEKLEPIFDKSLQQNELFLYTNYYGIKNNTIKKLISAFGDKLIVDNSQAFYDEPHPNIDTFYSARKFFGVPDGAYLCTSKIVDIQMEEDISIDRLSHLVKRIEMNAGKGYADFASNDKALNNQPIRKMSKLTSALLGNIDYSEAKKRRIENFQYLHTLLKEKNLFCFEDSDYTCPMVYPFYTEDDTLRKKLIDNKVYIATYWNNVLEWTPTNSIESRLVKNLLPLPIDQRYTFTDMDTIKRIIDSY